MLTWEKCRNFKSLSLSSQALNPRNFLTERLRKSRQQVPQQGTPTTGYHTPSAVTPYVNMGKMPEFQIATVLQPNNESANLFTERLRRRSKLQEAPQRKKLATTGHRSFSSVTPYTKKVEMPEFQISPVLRTLNI
jgi:hypothetical protein